MLNSCEEKLVRYLSDKITKRLQGEQPEFDRLTVKPSRRFFVGTLLPRESEKWKSIINPSAMGIEFIVDDSSPCELTITISFELYYLTYPTFEEQRNSSTFFANSEEDYEEDAGTDLIKVFKRERFTSTASIDISREKGTQISLKKYFEHDFQNLLQKIRNNQSNPLFRNKGTAVWSTKFLQNEAIFSAYLKSRNGTLPQLSWDFATRRRHSHSPK